MKKSRPGPAAAEEVLMMDSFARKAKSCQRANHSAQVQHDISQGALPTSLRPSHPFHLDFSSLQSSLLSSTHLSHHGRPQVRLEAGRLPPADRLILDSPSSGLNRKLLLVSASPSSPLWPPSAGLSFGPAQAMGPERRVRNR